MSQSITDTDTLTARQSAALEKVRQNAGKNVEEIADCNVDMYVDLYWLFFNRYIVIDERTQAVTVKG